MIEGFVADYTCIDIETTGLKRNCEILEIAAARVRNNQVVETFQELVKPTEPISAEISAITGITNSTVENARYIDEVLIDFFDFVGDDMILGHNIRCFDLDHIRLWSLLKLEKDFVPQYIDTLELSKEIPLKHHTLEVMCDYYGIENKNAHRALSDVMATIALYNHLINGDRNPNYTEKSAPKKHFGGFVNSSDIKPTTANSDTSHPLYGKVCVISGAFEMPRVQVLQAIADSGGINADNITRKTNILILGKPDSNHQGGYGGTKWNKAESYREKGYDIKYISEDELYKMIKKEIKND